MDLFGVRPALLHVFAILLGVLVLLVLSFRLIERRLTYIPRPLAIGALEEKLAEGPAGPGVFEEVEIPTPDGETLVGWYGRPEEPRATLLWLHGNAGNVSHRFGDLTRFVRESRLAVLIPDYRGYGRSSGRPHEEGIAIDARAAFDWLLERGAPPERTFLLGRSLGGAVAVRLALERPAAGVIIESVFTSIRDMARVKFPWFPAHWLARERYPTDERIARVPCPILLLHGRNDEIVPFRQAEELVRRAREGGREIEFCPVETGHNDLSEEMSSKYFERVSAFIGGRIR